MCVLSRSHIAARPTLCDPVDCSPPGSAIPGILQARILEWVATPSSRESPDAGIQSASPELQADSLPVSHREDPVMSVSSSQLHVTRILEISQEESHHRSQQTLQIRASFNVFLSRRKKLMEHMLTERIILDNGFVSSHYIVNGTKN